MWQSLLQARKLAKPTGRPLFTYRITDSEFTSVGEALRKGDLASSEWGILFCLFGAEHIRRNYEGGPWKWEPIFEAIQYAGGLNPLYERVERGIERLGRKLQRSTAGDRRFWLTLMCEGGIPMRILNRDQAPLTQFLRLLLAEAERFPAFPIEQTADRVANLYLGTFLRNEAFLEFSVRLTAAIRDLRSRVRGESSPIDALDRKHPNWRDEIPTALDDRNARRLLEGLLTSPRQSVVKGNSLALDTYIDLKSELLFRCLRPGIELTDDDLSRLLGPLDSTPSRLILQLSTEAGEHISIGVLTRRSGGGYALRVTLPSGVAIHADRLTPIVFAQGSRRLATVVVAGSEPMGDNVWTFAPANERIARLVSVASCRSTAERLLLALPQQTTLTVHSGEDRPLGWSVLDRPLVELRGNASCVVDGKSTSVSTQQTTASRTFRLDGKLRATAMLGRNVFEGMPNVIELHDDGERSVPRTRIQVRHLQGGLWQESSRPIFGDMKLRVLDQNEVVFATQCAVVPPDFTLTLLPSPLGGGLGHVAVASRELDGIAAEASEHYSFSPPHVVGVTHSIELRAERAFPVRLRVRFINGGQFEALVPFPAKLNAFAHRLGNPIPNGTELTVRALTGVYARCVAPPGKVPREIDVEARIEGGHTEYIGQLVEREGIGKELQLESVRERIELLLSSVDGDRDVRLMLAERGATLGGAPYIILKRYDGFLEPEKHVDREVLTLHKMQNAFGSFESLRVQAIPLWRPGEAPEILERDEQGRWVFRYEGHAFGPWLVTGWLGDSMPIRPLRVTVPGSFSQRPRPQLEEIVRSPTNRREKFHALCNEICESWSHSEWRGYDDYLKTLGVFPTFTFEAIRALVLHPSAAIIALLRSGDASEVQRRWREFEQLPMSWFMLPLRAWLMAGVILREEATKGVEACAAAGIGKNMADLVEALIDPLVTSSRPQFVTCMREAWSLFLADFPDVEDGLLKAASRQRHRDMFVQLVRSRADDLSARHADEHWPQVHPKSLPGSLSASRAQALSERLWPSMTGTGFRRSVLEAPIVAAAAMIEGEVVAADVVLAIKRIRQFDYDWFEFAHAVALCWFIGEELERSPTYLDDVAGLSPSKRRLQ